MVERRFLQVDYRDVEDESPRRLRASGVIPGIVYSKGSPAQPVKIKRDELVKFLRARQAGMMEIGLPGGATRLVLLQQVQRSPLTGEVLHVDFRQVSLQEPVRTQVPVVVTGEEELLKSQAVLQHQLREVEVESLPQDLPDEVKVDVSQLSIGDQVRAGDLKLPAGVSLLTDADEIVLLLLAPKPTAEEVPSEAPEEEGEPDKPDAEA